MRGTLRYSTLPDNADKILFAEDFVNHILLKFKLPLLSSGIADHRALIYNAFNSEVRLGANYVYSCLEEEMSEEFDNILKQNAIDINSFLKYVIPLRFHTNMLPNDLGAQNLMHFCVKISTIAAKFYMHGYLDAPVLAVDYIISFINDTNMVDEGWGTLNIVAAGYAQLYIDMDNYLTPESASDYEWESDSLSTLSSKNSEKSCSPEHEMGGEDGQEEHPEELTDDDYCNLCIAALRSSSGEPVSSSSNCKHVKKTNDAKAFNIMSSSDSTSDSMTSGSSKEKNSVTSYQSFEVTSSEDESSIQNERKKRIKPSCSFSSESESDTDKCETDLKTADYLDPFGRQLIEKRSAILSSPIKEFHKSDSAHHFKSSSTDNHTTDDTNTSFMPEGGRVKCFHAISSPMQLSVPKRKK